MMFPVFPEIKTAFDNQLMKLAKIAFQNKVINVNELDRPMSNLTKTAEVKNATGDIGNQAKEPNSTGLTPEKTREEKSAEETAETAEQLQPNSSVKIDGVNYSTDDNGQIYMKEGELLPNISYEVNGYKYKTDELWRIISAEGDLHLKDRDGRLPLNENMEDIGRGDQKDSDDRGHLIGDQFDGSNKLDNLVPMDSELNRGDYRALEKQLADALKDGKDVHVKVESIYEGDSARPSAFKVTSTIDKVANSYYFLNGGE